MVVVVLRSMGWGGNELGVYRDTQMEDRSRHFPLTVVRMRDNSLFFLVPPKKPLAIALSCPSLLLESYSSSGSESARHLKGEMAPGQE